MAKHYRYSVERTSILISLFYEHYESIIIRGLTRDSLYNAFVNDLNRHSWHSPPFSYGVFTSDESNEIKSLFINTLWHNCDMYRWVFNPKDELIVKVIYRSEPLPETRESEFTPTWLIEEKDDLEYNFEQTLNDKINLNINLIRQEIITKDTEINQKIEDVKLKK